MTFRGDLGGGVGVILRFEISSRRSETYWTEVHGRLRSVVSDERSVWTGGDQKELMGCIPEWTPENMTDRGDGPYKGGGGLGGRR